MKVDGKKIRLCREERAWTQRHLADAARVSLRTVQRMEKDGIGSKESLMSIAAALDLSVDDFLIAGNHKSTETFGNPLRFYLRVGGLFFYSASPCLILIYRLGLLDALCCCQAGGHACIS